MIKAINDGTADVSVSGKKQSKSVAVPAEYDSIRQGFAHKLGRDVKMSCSVNGSGKISFSFKSADELRQLLELFK